MILSGAELFFVLMSSTFIFVCVGIKTWVSVEYMNVITVTLTLNVNVKYS